MTTFVVDLSHYQAGLDVKDLQRAGVNAVILQTSQGMHVDPAFHNFYSAAVDAEMLVSGYHFLRKEWSPESQGLFATSHIDDTLPMWIDVEGGLTQFDGERFARTYMMHGGNFVGFYNAHQPTHGGWWKAAYGLDPRGPIEYCYAANGGDHSEHWEPNLDLWQFARYCRVAGYPGDLDVSAFRGTQQQLADTGYFLDFRPHQNGDNPVGALTLILDGNDAYIIGGDRNTDGKTRVHILPGGPASEGTGTYHDLIDKNKGMVPTLKVSVNDLRKWGFVIEGDKDY